MKKFFAVLCSVFFLSVSFNAAHAQDKVIGEKSNKVIGEKSNAIIGEKGQPAEQARMTKLKNEINAYYSDFLKKQAAAESAMTGLRKKIQQAMKELEAKDKLGNFEIQDLMSTYNQAETLSSQVHKKVADTKNAVISKL